MDFVIRNMFPAPTRYEMNLLCMNKNIWTEARLEIVDINNNNTDLWFQDIVDESGNFVRDFEEL